MNKEADTHDLYTLAINFRGSDKNIFVYLSPAEKERFERNLHNEPEPDLPARFFIADTLDGKTVAINLSKIQMLRIFWDPTAVHTERLIRTKPERPLLVAPLKYLFEGQSDFNTIDVAGDRPTNLSDFFSDLEDADRAESNFLGFLDVDWEQAFFNIHDLLYLETLQSVLQLEEEMEKEEEEDA